MNNTIGGRYVWIMGMMLRDVFVRFRHVEHVDGEPTEDGRVIVHYDERGRIAAVEITDVTSL